MAVKAQATITLVRVNDGETGKGVEKTEVFYYLSTSNTTQTGGSWVTTPPSWVDGRYYWQKIKTTFTDGSSDESKPVCITGGQGASGSAGKSVSSITTQFYLSTSKTTQTGGSWVETMPTWSPGKYLWTRSKIIYTNPSSTVYTAAMCDSSWEAVNDISIGARNLIIRKTEEKDKYIDTSGKVVAWADHSVSDYIEITPNTEYMFSRNESTVSDGGYFRYAWYTSAKAYIGRASNAELEFSWTAPSNAYFIRISYPTECKVKFERGNKATDWTPAPEDMATSDEVQNAQDTANGASDKADATDGRVTVAEATIQILQDSIMSLVTDENGSSMMTQNGSGWTFNIGAILNSVDAATNQLNDLSGTLNNVDSAINNLQSLADDLVKKTAYIIMTQDDTGAPCIELGKEDNPFKVRITNTSVDFMEGTSKIAYVSNQAMFIKKAIIKEELQIGEGEGFVWRKRSNGNMGLRWVGGGS